jgi:glycosyltransferase involved in cell wall biosynthesis
MLVLNKFTHDTRVLKEASTLAGAGYTVTVWALGDGVLPTHEWRNGFEVKRWQSKVEKWRVRFPGLMSWERFVAMTRRLLNERADVYHAHDASALSIAYLPARWRSARLIYDAHELWMGTPGQNWKSRLRLAVMKQGERSLINHTQGVITVNDSIARELNNLYGVEPIVLMNCQEYVNVEKSDILRQELNIPAQDRVAIYAGSWTHGRGLEKLIAAVPYLDRVVVVFMGRDRLDGKLQRLAREFGVQDRVRFRVPVPPSQVTRYVASADLGLMPTQAIKPSYYYGSGNKLFHYIMSGIPAAVSDHPEKRRIVETYKVGAVFDETDPENIAQTINALLNDEVRHQQLCHNARRAAREELNWGVEEQKLLRLYRSLQASQ